MQCVEYCGGRRRHRVHNHRFVRLGLCRNHRHDELLRQPSRHRQCVVPFSDDRGSVDYHDPDRSRRVPTTDSCKSNFALRHRHQLPTKVIWWKLRDRFWACRFDHAIFGLAVASSTGLVPLRWRFHPKTGKRSHFRTLDDHPRPSENIGSGNWDRNSRSDRLGLLQPENRQCPRNWPRIHSQPQPVRRGPVQALLVHRRF